MYMRHSFPYHVQGTGGFLGPFKNRTLINKTTHIWVSNMFLTLIMSYTFKRYFYIQIFATILISVLVYTCVFFCILICSRKLEAASKFSQNTNKGLKPGLKAHICC